MDPSDDKLPVKKKFRIQRRRLGKITYIDKEGKYGFIDGEDFREDVFFHVRDWENTIKGDKQAKTMSRSAEPGQTDGPHVGLWVEFEINEEFFETEKRLRASVVRPTQRPTGRRLSGRDATFNIVTHHQNARRKRPTWRK